MIKGEASSSTNYERSDSQETVKSSSQDSGFSEDVSSQKNLEEVVESSESDEEIAKRNEGIKKSLAMANSSLALADSLCNLCFSRPKDACLIHGRTSHQYCCYSCAKKLYKKRQGCPVCRRKIEKITKNIVAWKLIKKSAVITIIFAFFKVRTLWQNEDIIETFTVTTQRLKSTEKVAFNVCILSGQKFIKKAKWSILASFWKPEMRHFEWFSNNVRMTELIQSCSTAFWLW